MKGLIWVGLVLVVLGLLSFVVPIPHQEDHSLQIGDAKIGVKTNSSERAPPLVSGLLIVGGVVVLVAGARKSS